MKNKKKSLTQKLPYRWLTQQTKPAKRWLFLSVVFGVISGVIVILQSGLLATIIDRIYLHNATTKIIFSFLFSFLILVFLRSMLTWMRELISFQSAKFVKDTVRKNCLEKIMGLSPIELSQLKTGALTSTLIEQVEALHGFFADYLPQMTIAVLLPLIILIVVFMQNWIAGLLLLITAPLIPLFMAFIGINTARLNQENFQALSKMSAHFLDMLQGLTTLSLFNRAHAQLKTIETVSNAYREKTMKILRIAFLSTATLELFSTISIAMIAVYLGLGLLGFLKIGFEGVHITLQHALFILLLAPEFFMPLRQLGTFYHARAEAIGAAEEILKVLSGSASESESASDNVQIQNNISVVLKNISFSYPNQKEIIHNYNLTVQSGDCVAITGPSGSGKTTLINLIAKFLLPTEGTIFINQNDLNKIDKNNWYEHIALLHQHPRLFHGSIIDNIRFAKPSATDDEINHAARIAGVLEFTQLLPNGLNTLVGEQNLGLSGGQAQRVAIARIILKDAPLILLDEPTAHLDAKNVHIILELLKQWRGNKTVIIATHDDEIVKNVAVSVSV